MRKVIIATIIAIISTAALAAEKEQKGRLPHLPGEAKNGTSYTIRNLEVVCRKDDYKYCYTSLTPKHLR